MSNEPVSQRAGTMTLRWSARLIAGLTITFT
jgi:hypothetical protein